MGLYNTYTVVKTEWMLYVEFPYHAYLGNNYTDTDLDTTAKVATMSIDGPMEMRNPPNNAKARIFTHYVSAGDSIVPVNPPLNKSTLEMERWFNTYDNKLTVGPNTGKVLRGTWTPKTVNHNPINENDIEVWSQADNVPASSHLEHLIIQFKAMAQ